jgi:hypothetical protein
MQLQTSASQGIDMIVIRQTTPTPPPTQPNINHRCSRLACDSRHTATVNQHQPALCCLCCHATSLITQLSRELLSPQQHYDWGLRALKTSLGIAGRQLRDVSVNRPKLWTWPLSACCQPLELVYLFPCPVVCSQAVGNTMRRCATVLNISKLPSFPAHACEQVRKAATAAGGSGNDALSPGAEAEIVVRAVSDYEGLPQAAVQSASLLTCVCMPDCVSMACRITFFLWPLQVCATKLPTLTFDDNRRFRALLGDLFPGVQVSKGF